MTTEEKARAYDEALKKAKEIKEKIMYSHLSTESCKAVSEYIDTIIPELRESEDDKIRKAIIKSIEEDSSVYEQEVSKEQMITWLKKQKETNIDRLHKISTPADENWFEIQKQWEKEDENERIRKWLYDFIHNCPNETFEFYGGVGKKAVLTYLEKQKEQKPIHSAEEKEYIRTLKSLISDFLRGKEEIDRGYYQQIYDWLDGRQKPVESISQLTVQGKGVYKICPRCKERMVRDDSMVYTSMPPQYIYKCPKCGERECDTAMYDNPEIEEKQEQKQEWSEEDEKWFDFFERLLEFGYNKDPHHLGKLCIDGKMWLKSLRPSWKPSEVQMSMLLAVINDPNNAGAESCQIALRDLYQALKKL